MPSVGIPDAEHNTNEPYLEYYSFLLDMANEELPQVISNSYGDDEQSVPIDGESLTPLSFTPFTPLSGIEGT